MQKSSHKFIPFAFLSLFLTREGKVLTFFGCSARDDVESSLLRVLWLLRCENRMSPSILGNFERQGSGRQEPPCMEREAFNFSCGAPLFGTLAIKGKRLKREVRVLRGCATSQMMDLVVFS